MPRLKKNKNRVRVVEKKLGREAAYGQAFIGENYFEIDPRQKARQYLNTCIHEYLHLFSPESSETKILNAGNELSRILWEAGYRRIQK